MADRKIECFRFVDQRGELQQSAGEEIKRLSLSDGHKVVTAFGLPSDGKNAFLNLVFGTDFEVIDGGTMQQGIWVGGAKNTNAVILNVEDRDCEMAGTIVRNCALLSMVFSDIHIFHITNTRYRHVVCFIKALFELVIGLTSKAAPMITGQILLLFIVTPTSSGVPVPWVQNILVTDLERTWAEQGKPPELMDRRLYDYFDISFTIASPELTRPEWMKADIAKPKARFFDKNQVDYVFQPRYRKKIAIDKLGLYMEHLWLQINHEHIDLSLVRSLIESFRLDEVSSIVRDQKPSPSKSATVQGVNGSHFSTWRVSQGDAAASKVSKSIQAGVVPIKVYVDAEVQAQSDAQLKSNASPLSLLLTILRNKKPGSAIGSVLNVATIDLVRSLLAMKNYVNAALQLTDTSDTELLLDFMLHLLCYGHLSCSEVPDANRRARRLMLKMIIKTPVAPSSLFIKGINARVDYDYVGRGGFGFVFKGELEGNPVALKLLYKTRHNDDFCREALMWRSLNHERVLPFLGIFEDDSRMFLVSPYMKNGTLSQWRKNTDPSTSEIQRLISEVAEGIQYIHSEGIVHGDLRGDNVLLDASFHVQITDFGLTRHSEATVTQSGALHYNFAAPELLGNWDEEEDVSESEDDGQLTARTQKSDVYAFGCLYYEIQFDVIPFQGANEIQIVKLVSRGKRPSRLDEPPLSDKAWKLIKRCWVKEAVRRPAMEDIVEKMMAV